MTAGTPQQCKPITVGPYTKIHIQYSTVHITYSTWTGD